MTEKTLAGYLKKYDALASSFRTYALLTVLFGIVSVILYINNQQSIGKATTYCAVITFILLIIYGTVISKYRPKEFTYDLIIKLLSAAEKNLSNKEDYNRLIEELENVISSIVEENEGYATEGPFQINENLEDRESYDISKKFEEILQNMYLVEDKDCIERGKILRKLTQLHETNTVSVRELDRILSKLPKEKEEEPKLFRRIYDAAKVGLSNNPTQVILGIVNAILLTSLIFLDKNSKTFTIVTPIFAGTILLQVASIASKFIPRRK